MKTENEFIEWVQRQADQLEPETVPPWPREHSYQGQQELAWWQRPWLPMASLATSFMAVFMVLAQVQLTIDEHGFSLRFGDNTQQQLTALVEQRMAEYGADQQVLLANYASNLRADLRTDMATEIASANQTLVNYLLATSREERRDDMAELIRYVNSQREDDQVYFANQLQQLSEDWYLPQENE